MLIDSHFHIDLLPDAEHADIMARAQAAGIAEVVTIGTSLEQSRQIIAISESWPNMWCMIGVHPHNAAAPVPSTDEILALTTNRKVIGLGESGLDYHYETAPHDEQQQSFRAHIRAARQADLPLAIHARAADEDVIAMLRDEMARGKFAFLLHCFSSGPDLAAAAVELGGYLSFSGILTFPKSAEIREIARHIPRDRLLVETDSPYLAPVPYRGKRNEPAFVTHTAATLAGLHNMSPEEMAELTTANFRRLFRRAA